MPNTESSIQDTGIPQISFTVSAAETVQAPIDDTLSIEGMAADAKATGDAINEVAGDLSDLAADVSKCEVRVVNLGTVSSLPKTQVVSGMETDEVCIHAELGTPSAQTGTWTVNTNTAGQVTLSGSITGSTTVKLYLMKSR